jgi:RNA polymerase sigma-70 factor (ECF subfamily)
MSHSAPTDEELMQRFARGEASAFDVLYERYELRVFRYLLRTLRDRARAEDVLQDVWFIVARDASRFEPIARFSAWMFRIAHNRMVDAVRAARREVSLDLAGAAQDATAPMCPGESEPHAAAVADEELVALLAALAQLPSDQCEAFLLQQEGGLSVEEIATVTGCPFETAKSRLRYARETLRELLRGNI